MKTCCVTGHRPKGFPWDYGKPTTCNKIYNAYMTNQIQSLINDGYTHFISGGAIGVDTDFANIVIKLKRLYPYITLEIAVPCNNQDLKWKQNDKIEYSKILLFADKTTVVSQDYTKECMLKRNRYMVDSSDIVLAYWNNIDKGGTFYTIKYAKSRDKNLIITDLNIFI